MERDGGHRRARPAGAHERVTPTVHLSIVSHLQSRLVTQLLADIAGLGSAPQMRVTVLSNIPEPPPTIPTVLSPNVEHLTNETPAGFGANHNRVFRRCSAPYFCVMNPDLRLETDPFPELVRVFANERVAMAAPAANDRSGALQDNARRLPSPWRIASKLWARPLGPDYSSDVDVVYPDWVAGFFMLFRSNVFRELGGFDERYFLYYEDMDLCSRIRLAGLKIAWVPGVKVVHDARRHSHSDARYLLWHLRSITRFFASPVYRAARRLQPGPSDQSRL